MGVEASPVLGRCLVLEQTGDMIDGSPWPPHKRSAKSSSKKPGSQKVTLDIVSCDSQPDPSTSQLLPASEDGAQTTNESSTYSLHF